MNNCTQRQLTLYHRNVDCTAQWFCAAASFLIFSIPHDQNGYV